ncbi:MAG TPA: hypothetical protein VG937_23545 [Polyangiaceae bacterium]|jgi:hypothetical protein|nr:hypothetical protein [Polyangiaceae bacterium]
MKTVLKAAALLMCFSAVGCGAEGSESASSQEQHLDVAPATLADATAELSRADVLLANGADPTVISAELAQLRERLDDLNGRVAHIDLEAGHVVNFYQDASGNLVVGERQLVGTPSALAALDLSKLSAAELFVALAPQRTVPEALLRNPTARLVPVAEAESQAVAPTEVHGEVSSAPQLTSTSSKAGNIGRSQQALTGADGAFFRANFCPQNGVFFFCNPNWSGGLFAQANATHSKFSIAPFAGGGSVQTTVKVNGSSIGSFATFMGEVQTFFAMSGTHSVKDSGCCFICACGTHPEVKVQLHRWDVSAAGKDFHAGGRFLNDKNHIGFE